MKKNLRIIIDARHTVRPRITLDEIAKRTTEIASRDGVRGRGVAQSTLSRIETGVQPPRLVMIRTDELIREAMAELIAERKCAGVTGETPAADSEESDGAKKMVSAPAGIAGERG